MSVRAVQGKYPKLDAKIQLTMNFHKAVDSHFSFGDLESLNK